MKAKNFLMIFAIVAMAGMFSGCPGTITGPNPPPPPPPPEKTYTLQIQYIRTYANPDFILAGVQPREDLEGRVNGVPQPQPYEA